MNMAFSRLLITAMLTTGCMGELEDIGGVDDSTPSMGRSLAIPGKSARVEATGGAGLRLRSGAGSQYAVLLVMPEGATVDVLAGPTSGWFQVEYAATTGWAHGDYLEPVTTQVGGANNLLPWTAYTAYYITQGHNGGSHIGNGAWAWDIGMPMGTPVLAAHFGTVRAVKGDSRIGGCSSAYANDANFVIIDQGNGYESLYLHVGSVTVSPGQQVNRGDLVAYSGQSGWSCGPHLHFQVQLSPSNGGGNGFYNPSIRDYFYDAGYAWDPPYGALASSRNGVSNQPRVAPPEPFAPFEPHGGAEWDLAMREASDAMVQLIAPAHAQQ